MHRMTFQSLTSPFQQKCADTVERSSGEDWGCMLQCAILHALRSEDDAQLCSIFAMIKCRGKGEERREKRE